MRCSFLKKVVFSFFIVLSIFSVSIYVSAGCKNNDCKGCSECMMEDTDDNNENKHVCPICSEPIVNEAAKLFCCDNFLHENCAELNNQNVGNCTFCGTSWKPLMRCCAEECQNMLLTIKEDEVEAHILPHFKRQGYCPRYCVQSKMWTFDDTCEQFTAVACKYCEQKFSGGTILLYDRHLRSMHPEENNPIKYSCKECVNPKSKGLTLPEFEQHVVRESPDAGRNEIEKKIKDNALWYCSSCNESAKKQTILRAEAHRCKRTRGAQSEFQFVCAVDHCSDKEIKMSYMDIAKHIDQEHCYYQCFMCGFAPLIEEEQFIQHFANEHMYWVCPIGHCGRFRTKEDARVHMNEKHQVWLIEKIDNCPYCLKPFNKNDPAKVEHVLECQQQG